MGFVAKFGLFVVLFSQLLIGCLTKAINETHPAGADRRPTPNQTAGQPQDLDEPDPLIVDRPELGQREPVAFATPVDRLLERTGAALAIAESNTDPPALAEFDETVDQALAILERLEIRQVAAEPEQVAASTDSDRQAEIRFRVTADNRPVAGVGLLVEPVNGANTNEKALKLYGTSNDSGLVVFGPTDLAAVGNNRLTVFFDTGDLSDRLKAVSESYAPKAEQLLAALTQKTLTINYASPSPAKRFATAVILQDLDAKGRVIRGSTRGQQLFIKELTNVGFKVPRLSFGPSFLERKEDFDILAQLKKIFGSRAQRFVYGSVQIDQIDSDDGGVHVTMRGKLKLADVADQKIIWQIEESATADGAKLAEALQNGYVAISKTLVELLVRESP